MKTILFHITAVCLTLSSCGGFSYGVDITKTIPLGSKKIKRDTLTEGRLRFIDEVVIPTQQVFENTEIGGLSGIEYLGDSKYVALCDKSDNPRFYEFHLDYNPHKINEFKVVSLTELKDKTGDFKPHQADPESIRFDKEAEQIVWSSEGLIQEGIAPFIRVSDLEGNFKRELPLSEHYTMTRKTGAKHNQAIESVSLDLDGKSYWYASEDPLKQDKDFIRLLKVDKHSGEVLAEIAYRLDKIIRNGLVEVLTVSENKLLTLERAYNSMTGINTIRLFEIDVTDFQKNSIDKENLKPISKTLLLDFVSVKDKLSKVDNIEGVTLGKVLENGNRSLVFVSDDNFNMYGKQVSQIVVFELKNSAE